MSQHNCQAYASVQELNKLNDNRRAFKETILKSFEEQDKLSNKLHKTSIQPEDLKIDQRKAIQELTNRVAELQSEVERLRTDNERLEQQRIEHHQDLDNAGKMLTKRRIVAPSPFKQSASRPTTRPTDSVLLIQNSSIVEALTWK